MAHLLTNLGEEYNLATALAGASIKFGLYNDATDAITDTDDLVALTTEPSDGNYTRQAAAWTLKDISGDWHALNAAQVGFDVTDTTGLVDSYFVVANFQASDTGDGSAQDHLIATGPLTQDRDLFYLDDHYLPAETAGYKVN